MSKRPFFEENTYDNQAVSFQSLNSAIEFLRSQHAAWSEYLSEPFNSLRNEFQEGFRNLKVHLSSISDALDIVEKEENEGTINQLTKRMRGFVRDPNCGLAIKSDFTSMVTTIYSELGFSSAASAFHAMHHRGLVGTPKKDELLGAIAIANATLGVSKRSATAAKAALKRSIESGEKRYDALLEKSGNQLLELHNLRAEMSEFQRRAMDLEVAKVEDYKEVREKDRAEFAGRVDEEIARLNETRDTYVEFMALQAPANYWSSKAKNHRNFALLFALLAASFTIIGGWWLFQLFSGSLFAPTMDETGSSNGVASVWVWILLGAKGLLVSTIYLWAIRILVRLFLSEVHLGMDARERFTMVKCYLALKNEGVTDDASLKVVLDALFRPTQDGIVKDDASTDPMIAALLRYRN